MISRNAPRRMTGEELGLDHHEQRLLDMLPDDNSKQVGDWHYATLLQSFLGANAKSVEVLDLGAGEGQSLARLIGNYPEGVVKWTGVDIDDSDEVRGRPANCPPIDFYDGSTLPYKDARFDVVWSRQVLEHVRYPDKVISEVARVLRPGGYFLGSVSQLEPYHSRSVFNWTHYGVMTVFADHGLKTMELRAGIDGPTLLVRSLFGRRSNLSRFFRVESPFNVLLEQMAVSDQPRSKNVKAANFQKLKAAGHIHFAAKKVE